MRMGLVLFGEIKVSSEGRVFLKHLTDVATRAFEGPAGGEAFGPLQVR